MSLSNFHTHSKYCDGKDELEIFVKKAIEKRMNSIGFSSHAPLPFSSDGHMKNNMFQNYLDDINKLKNKYYDKIKIYSGLEVDFIPNIIGPKNFNKYNLDFLIGSVHYVGQYKNGEHFLFDITLSEFKKGLKIIYRNDIKKLVEN